MSWFNWLFGIKEPQNEVVRDKAQFVALAKRMEKPHGPMNRIEALVDEARIEAEQATGVTLEQFAKVFHPQKGPSSPAKIEAETKQVKRQLDRPLNICPICGAEDPMRGDGESYYSYSCGSESFLGVVEGCRGKKCLEKENAILRSRLESILKGNVRA